MKTIKKRKTPGTGGIGKFYRIEVEANPKKKFFTIFRTQDVGEEGHLERIAGKRSDGTWDTVTWLIAKEDAHIRGNKLIIDNEKIRNTLKSIRGKMVHKKGDIFSTLSPVHVS